MNIMDIKTLDIANGPGCRISVFVSGCRRHCKGCFNPESWNFNNGEKFTDETIQQILLLLAPDYIEGLSVLGGEPFEPENQESVLKLISAVKQHHPNKSIWIYSGYTFQELYIPNNSIINKILELIDVLVEGEFIESQKDLRLQFCGSTNQEIIDVQKTMDCKLIHIHDKYHFTPESSAIIGEPIRRWNTFFTPNKKQGKRFNSMEREVKAGEVYKHFKGHTCKVLAIAKHTETGEDMVVYNHVNEADEEVTWARPLSMFNSKVDKDKYPDVAQEYRFEKVE